MLDNNQKNIATIIHLSTFSRFIIPLGNFIAPIILWVLNKDKSEFIDKHGKEAINFQISILVYSLIIGLVTIPFFVFKMFSGFSIVDFNWFDNIQINIGEPTPLFYLGGALGGLAIIGFIIEIALIITASLKAKEGETFQYPFCIHFIK